MDKETGYIPHIGGNSFGIQFYCSRCAFPENDTLTTDMSYCWNCGAKLDWSEWKAQDNKTEVCWSEWEAQNNNTGD